MTSTTITRQELADAARRALRPGISEHQAVVIGYSQLVGEPLDPWSFDDAAVILRSERLIRDGLSVVDAVSTARDELITWNRDEA